MKSVAKVSEPKEARLKNPQARMPKPKTNAAPAAGAALQAAPSTTARVATRARMRDVADLAGVGTMTVSRVIGGTVPVSEETRNRVLAAIEQLDYRPNEVARSLREARTRSIGIIVPNFFDSFFACCAHEVNLVAQEHGYSVMVTTSDEDAMAEYNKASLMMRRNVEGLIVIPAWMGTSQLSKPEFSSIPIVALDRPINSQSQPHSQSDASPNLTSVVVENRKGAERGVQHLIEHGHKHIVFLSLSHELYTLAERHAGYVHAMKKAGLKPEAYFTCTTQKSTLEVLRGLKSAGRLPTAIFASNNLVTQHTLHALMVLKVAVPKKVAIAAFDDLEMFDIFVPQVTVLRQPIQEMGRVAAELLFARLTAPSSDAAKPPESRSRILPVELVVRRSCGCHAP
jgi:LacI family transcriptional regulator